MCSDCPHCAESDFPCQDAFGSSAELVGGFAGRADALFGAVEAQKTNGSLHFHFKLFVQRLHQYCTLKEIAKLIENGLASLDEFKQYISNICTEAYPGAEQHEKEKKTSKFTGHALTRTVTPQIAHASGARRDWDAFQGLSTTTVAFNRCKPTLKAALRKPRSTKQNISRLSNIFKPGVSSTCIR